MLMEDEPTNAPDTEGKKPDTTPEEPKKDLSEFEKLKVSNDEFEKELVRGRELKAESQKLEAEKMLGGTTGGHIEAPEDKLEKQAEAGAKEIVDAFR